MVRFSTADLATYEANHLFPQNDFPQLKYALLGGLVFLRCYRENKLLWRGNICICCLEQYTSQCITTLIRLIYALASQHTQVGCSLQELPKAKCFKADNTWCEMFDFRAESPVSTPSRTELVGVAVHLIKAFILVSRQKRLNS